MSKLSSWHRKWQDKFPKENQEVRFYLDQSKHSRRVADVWIPLEQDERVIEYQHSRITKEEVNARNIDYNSKSQQMVWMIDCTENKNKPTVISNDRWLIDFEKEWHVNSMEKCKVLFADFGDYIYRIPIACVRQRMVLVSERWKNDEDFVSYLLSPDIPPDCNEPKQSTLTVAQDPHGSGKTYRLSQMLIRTDLDEYKNYSKYDTFIIITKSHSAKNVVNEEFRKQLEQTGLKYDIEEKQNKYIYKFTKRWKEEKNVMCIFGTVDSLMYNLAENKVKGVGFFENIVKTIHEHGPTKLKGPKGRFNYAGKTPRLNGKTLIVCDESSLLEESYLDAFSSLMNMCSVDVHLAGDVQQSTLYENNMMTKIMTEYNTSNSKENLPSFPNSIVNIKVGNEVRRFNKKLVEFRNKVMEDFHRNPSHKLNIPEPVVAKDMNHSSQGEYTISLVENLKVSDNDSAEFQYSVEEIMENLHRDMEEYELQPNDIIIVTPFVTKNALMQELQSKIHEFWYSKIKEPAYRHLLDVNHETLPWLCVLHRSEEGKPIDTTESENATRIVSIHASQGDGRKVAYVVGLTEKKLKRFTARKINIKYESLLNVAISRMKEIIRVFLEPVRDDIWERFKPFIPEELQKKLKLDLLNRNILNVNSFRIENLELEVFNKIKDTVKEKLELEPFNSISKGVIDYGHHIIRYSCVHTIFDGIGYKRENFDYKEQLSIIYQKIIFAKVESLSTNEYYKIFNSDSKYFKKSPPCIPILKYNTGSSSFNNTHDYIEKTLSKIQKIIESWNDDDEEEFLYPQPHQAVVIQYAVELMTFGSRFLYEGTVKMDHVYEVCNSYMLNRDNSENKLQQHYDYLNDIADQVDQIYDYHDWAESKEKTIKINRSIHLGKKNGNKTQYFQLSSIIKHLLITDQYAVPIIIISDISELNIPEICFHAIIYTLFCLQPHKYEGEERGNPTWRYLKDKKIRVCFLSIKGDNPLFIDITDLVEENIVPIAIWLGENVKEHYETEIPIIVQHLQFADDFENEKEKIQEMYSEKKCLEYVRDAINECESPENISEKLKEKLNLHISLFTKDIKSRRK